MKAVLEALKARFIDQDGLTVQQAVEQEMARELRKVLRDARILPAYQKDVKIGPEEFQVTFALVGPCPDDLSVFHTAAVGFGFRLFHGFSVQHRVEGLGDMVFRAGDVGDIG
jgi:hypothetical protein